MTDITKQQHRSIRVWFGLLLSTLTLTGAACSIGFTPPKPDGGVFKSTDQGKTWNQTVFVTRTQKEVITIGTLTINELVVSPVDSSTVYALTAEQGLYETVNGGDSWQQVFNSSVTSVAPDPQRHDVLMLASGNKIYRTTDNGQNWQVVYLEATPNAAVREVAIQPNTPKLAYAATSQGVIIRSLNEGSSWQQVHYFGGPGVKQLIVNPKDPKVMYAALDNDGLFRSDDQGNTWLDITQNLHKQLNLDPGHVRSLSFIVSRPDGVLLATDYGLFRTFDSGNTWENLQLVTLPRGVKIVGVQINPGNVNNIFYGTDVTVYRSIDAGQTWQTLVPPAPHPVTTLALNPRDPNIVYLGFGR